MKATKNTELGTIPIEWNSYRFEDAMTGFYSGATPYRAIEKFYKGTIRWITSGELNYNIIDHTDENITLEAVQKTNLRILPKGTFLIAITGLEAEGTRGRCAIVGKESTTNQSCMALMPINDKLITGYLFHFYRYYGDWLALKYCQGTKQQSYTGKIVKILPINLPPTLEEQKAIAQALSDVDELINSLDKLIAKKKNIKQATMQQLLTCKKRLPGFIQKWEKAKLGKVYSFLSTANNPRGELNETGEIGYIHYGDIHTKWNTYLDCDKHLLPKISPDRIGEVPFITEGDLIMADASEDYEGLGASVEVNNINDKKVVAGLHTLLLRPDITKVSRGFSAYIIKTKGVKDQLIKIATGISVYGISKNNLKDVIVSIPPLEEQKSITLLLNDMESEIHSLDRQRNKYKTIKQGMMQKLLTGQIRLV